MACGVVCTNWSISKFFIHHCHLLVNIFLIFIEVFLNIVFPCVAYFKCLLLVEIKQTKKGRVQFDAGERLAAHTDR